MQEIKVIDEDKKRIDSYLASNIDLSRSKIQKLIKDGKVLVNNLEVNSNYLVNTDDVIQIKDYVSEPSDIKGEDIPIEILYENEDLLVINKPSGMVVHPANGNYNGTLVNALIGKYSLSNDTIRPGIVHRLDKDTSGLLIVAKNDYAQEKLSEMMKKHEIKKTYLALVEGVFNHETGTIDAPIGRDNKNREKMMVTSINSKEAITHFKVLKRYAKHTLLEVNLETGRTHQIRVHMAYINHPIYNDPVYGKTIVNEEFGQLLHAKKLEFNNPRDGQKIVVEKDAPQEFYDIIEKYINN